MLLKYRSMITTVDKTVKTNGTEAEAAETQEMSALAQKLCDTSALVRLAELPWPEVLENDRQPETNNSVTAP
jgi:hypothetical protein